MKLRMKLRRFLLISLIICIYFITMNISIFDYINDTIETRLKNSLHIEPYTSIEFEDGYVCFYPDIETFDYELLSVAYLKESIFRPNGFAVRAIVGNDFEYYLKNKSLTRIFTLPLNNFSNHTIYFSLCEDEFVKPVTVNGIEADLYDVEIKYGEETFNRKCWIYYGKDEKYPVVKEINAGDGTVSSVEE